MVRRRQKLNGFPSRGEWAGIAALAAAGVLAPFSPSLAAVPLALFVIMCVFAPYCYRWNFFLPVVSRGKSGGRAVALTFDDGPDPLSTPLLIHLLAEHKIVAAFFINGAKAESHPDLVRMILANGHEVGNHSHNHDNFLMLKGEPAIRREIQMTQEVMETFGVRPLAFRPPVGIIAPGLAAPLADYGMFCVNFSFRVGDMGNRRIGDLAGKIIKRTRPDDIILLHDIAPPNASLQDWLKEIGRIIAGLREKKFAILPLSELIERPVMESLGLESGGSVQTPFPPSNDRAARSRRLGR